MVPEQLVAFKEKPICFTVVYKNKWEGKKTNNKKPQSKTKTIQPNKQKN